ncbi:MAG TPA: preprotein translocase subunit SecE [Candidatus Dojkabacteria bacterium]|nr:preprotein translocase subunit SecE [Candidatus Dojkabacteria bacterium]
MLKIVKEIGVELKNTSWPSRKNLAMLVLYTIIVCGIISLLIVGLDIFLLRIRDIIL